MKALIVCFGLVPCLLLGQDIQRSVFDSLTRAPLPFVTVATNFGDNTITNEEGIFRLRHEKKFTATDSVFISCMGFASYREAIHKLPDSVVYLPPKSIALEGIILDQQNLTAEEIIQKATEGFGEKYELSLTKKDFFMRESYAQRWNRREMQIKKSSISTFNQRFWDSLLATLPKQDAWHTESAGTLYGGWSNKKQKLKLTRAVALADTLNERGYEQIEATIAEVLDKNVKANSYFKIKSGIFSTKMDRDEIIDQENDSLPSLVEQGDDDQGKKSPEEVFHKERKKELRAIARFMNVDKDKLNIDMLTNASRYAFELVNYIYLNDTPVYVIAFSPARKKAKFAGTAYIDADRFALVQLEYKNTKDLRNFSLLGISFRLHSLTARIKFDRFGSEKYQLHYVERKIKFNTGIDRPLKIVEKNKFVRGRRKQNELVATIDMQLAHESKKTLFIHANAPLSTQAFETLEAQTAFSPEKRNNFDPKFWEGYTIVEPNAGLRSFRTRQD